LQPPGWVASQGWTPACELGSGTLEGEPRAQPIQDGRIAGRSRLFSLPPPVSRCGQRLSSDAAPDHRSRRFGFATVVNPVPPVGGCPYHPLAPGTLGVAFRRAPCFRDPFHQTVCLLLTEHLALSSPTSSRVLPFYINTPNRAARLGLDDRALLAK